MKVIAKVSDDTIIVEMKTSELAKITGFGSSFPYESGGSKACLPGTIHDVDDRYSILNTMSEIPSILETLKNQINSAGLRINESISVAEKTHFGAIKPKNARK